MISMKKLPSTGEEKAGTNQASTSTQAGQSVMLRLIMNSAGLPQTTTTTCINQGALLIPTVGTCLSTTTPQVEQKPQGLTSTGNDELIRRLSSDIKTQATKLYPTLGTNLGKRVAPGISTTLAISANQIMTASAGITAIAPMPAKTTVSNHIPLNIQAVETEMISAETDTKTVSSLLPTVTMSAVCAEKLDKIDTDLANVSTSDDVANPDSSVVTPHVFVKSKRSSRRPTQRLRMRPWLYSLLNSGEIPGLQWVKRDQEIFSIPWKHASGRTWKGEDADLFERYALHTGKHVTGGLPDHKRWKANFRCALNSLHDVEELQDRSMKTGEFAHKLYRFLTKAEKKSIAAKKAEKVSNRRKSDSSGGDMGDLLDFQNNTSADGKTKDWVYDELTGESRPPEIKDHNYSYNKGDLGISPVIDPQEIRDLLIKAPDSMINKEDQLSDTIAMETCSTLDALPRLPFFRNSIDKTIEKVVEKIRKKKRVKSELIIDDRSAQFVSNVMEVDTSPNNQSDDSARIALAHSLVSLKTGSFGEDPGLVTEESTAAASILLDLSRMKHSTGVRERLHSFVSERMEVENSVSVEHTGKTDPVTKKQASIKTSADLEANPRKMTSAELLAGALKGSMKKSNTDVDQNQPNPVSNEVNSPELTQGNIHKALDLRIKTEPPDDGYEVSMETSELANQAFLNSCLSSRNQFYRSSTESSESEEEDDVGAELIPPPAHNSSHSLLEIDDTDLPQPLDLSVKVHNLVITDVSPTAKKPNTSSNYSDQFKQDSSKRNFENSFQDSEPLDLKVKKIRDLEPCINKITSTTIGSLPGNTSEAQILPLDLSIVKSEPMDDSGQVYPQSSSIAMETEVINRIGPVPDLIEAPLHSNEKDGAMNEKQPVISSWLQPQDFTVKDLKVVAQVSGANTSTVSVESAALPVDVSLNQRNTVNPSTSSYQLPEGSRSLSAPTISFLLRQKSDLSCRFCEKSFVSSTELSSHMSTAHVQIKNTAHASHKKKHLCPICPKGFQKEANLAKHMKRHIRKSSVQCRDCKSIFKNKEFYLQHQNDCTAVGSSPCSRLQNPKQQQHESNLVENGDVLKPFQCGICNSGFEHIEDLKTHMESKLLLVRCSVCDKLFTKQSSETVENTFMCSVCENESQKKVAVDDLLAKPSLSTGMSLLLQAVERTVNKDAS